MLNASMMEAFASQQTLKPVSVLVKVEMTPSTMLEKLSKEIVSELHRLAPYSGYIDIANLDETDILKYQKTLVKLRCEKVTNGLTSKGFVAYKSIYDKLAVPVMTYQLLIAIGEAYDRDYAIKFEPEYTIDGQDMFSPSEMLAISDVFTRFEFNGLKVVYGLPKDAQGELDFMAMCSVEGIVKSYRTAHPVYAFLAAFFEQKKLNEVTGAMCRIIYGYESDYELYVTRLFRSLTP